MTTTFNVGDFVEYTEPARKLRIVAGLPVSGHITRIDDDGITEIKTASGERYTPHLRALCKVDAAKMPWRK